ncbi:TetM/TetW/TetO/TetS family tetracycline resistance ribosomal protection protein [Pseudomonas sp. CFBP 13711]|uniref:elongation factor G n=1 Tax=unclassified Pseudomonas TaxID=196821 RepID=UPI0017841185|nr:MULTISPECIES: TetM/TetW/TetO/TetS family tetracycline resistance ribosomal protection protein [unclassified Pseudomonas]MBD8706067.1 TetM/TetW/TetO/TetS family tetracycline resistance ribosomal protection protein [Pseudomonas sp. CFBP 13711]MBD8711965.1 TetM/TetW/TetO/TetS family tetracycline resistance ribosomal protection protein [Pseudomonas sp. CFBP 13715]
MKSLNLGILAHVDAGKTSLTERILFEAGARVCLGSVDTGSTFTDSLLLERERGITIKSAVASFELNGVLINLLDTPGHPDFIAEVERALVLLDIAIIVVSAVERVQAQTRVLVNALERMEIPYVFFINKIDRKGASFQQTLEALGTQLKCHPLALCDVKSAGSSMAVVEYDMPLSSWMLSQWLDVLCEHDDVLLHEYVTTPKLINKERLEQALRTQLGDNLVNPVFAGSAITGAGVAAMIEAITYLGPIRHCNANAPLNASVFKIDRGWGGHKRFHLVILAGTLHLRQTVETPHGSCRVTGIYVSASGGLQSAREATAGQIACVIGLDGVRIGDRIGVCSARDEGVHTFTPPAIETHVYAALSIQTKALWEALIALAEQDPLIDLRRNTAGQMFVSLYGEVQKEIIQAILQDEYAIQAKFEESSAICVEALLGTGEGLESLGDPSNPFLATVGLHVTPRAPGSGQIFTRKVHAGLMPASFYKAIEESVIKTLGEGRHGWPVCDCEVTLTMVDYESPSSTAADFRHLTPLVLAAAIEQAGTTVCEPRSQFHIEVPIAQSASIQTLLARAGAITTGATISEGTVRIKGSIVTTKIYKLQHEIPNVTSGLGFIESEFAAYAPVPGAPPSRDRSMSNPYHRHEYLRHIRLGTRIGQPVNSA